MKNKISFIIYYTLILLSARVVAQDTLYWTNGDQLEWEYFKKSPPERTDFRALATVGISGSFIEYNDLYCAVSIRSYFVTNKSWVKKRTAALLKHEQGHYDIAEIYSRKFREEVSGITYEYLDNVDALFKEIYNKYISEMYLMQELYDNETNFSRDQIKQQEWNKTINDELKSLSHFSSSIVTFYSE